MSDDKRSYERYDILFPVTLKGTGIDDEVMGVCRQAGAGGALLTTSAPLPPGAELVIRFRLSAELRDERTVKATVVRQELTQGELALAFPYLVAVEFAWPDPGLIEELKSAAEVAPNSR